jgi:serralysin
MPLTATEQYLLELINRGRLDPGAEAARYGIDLNANVAADKTISTAAKQVLAPNKLLEAAATGHSLWMLEADQFSHTGRGGSSLRDRVDATGYDWNRLGENIAAQGTSGTLNLKDAVEAHHAGLILSAGHRVNLMGESFTEVGLAQEAGRFVFQHSGELNASLVTEVFGTGGQHFLTGVVYNDRNRDGFYSVGEGRGGVSFSVDGVGGRAASAGGYSVAVTETGVVEVTGRVARTTFTAVVDFSDGNVKLDLVDRATLLSSADITLLTGVQNARLLGIADIDVTGTGQANRLTGNNGDNVLSGLGGADTLDGGGGEDLLIGGSGADRFVFAGGRGADVVQGFSAGEGDRLYLDDDLWAGVLTQAQVVEFPRVVNGDVVFDFGGGDSLTLRGVGSTANLAGAIDFW